jgi:hypothetical protein
MLAGRPDTESVRSKRLRQALSVLLALSTAITMIIAAFGVYARASCSLSTRAHHGPIEEKKRNGAATNVPTAAVHSAAKLEYVAARRETPRNAIRIDGWRGLLGGLQARKTRPACVRIVGWTCESEAKVRNRCWLLSPRSVFDVWVCHKGALLRSR